MGRLVILSGPSCIGKGPLHAALRKFFPAIAGRLGKVVLYNTRAPRPGEVDGVDYHFRPRSEIERFVGDGRFEVMDVRGDLQALDLRELEALLEKGDAFFEGNPFVGQRLLRTPDVEKLSVFLAPLSREEIVFLRHPDRKIDLATFVTDVMRRKLLRRTQRQKRILGLNDLQDIEARAGSAYRELKLAHAFEYVIVDHDGEDSENWDAFYYPIGDARRTLLAFADLLSGKVPETVEHWDESLVP